MKVSATLKSQEIVKERKRKKLPVYNFGLGANPLPISKEYVNELKKNSHHKNYVSASGIDEFQRVIQKNYSNENYKVGHILTGNGLKELLFIVQMAFEGTILHITPSWISYKEQITLLNKDANLIEIETKIEHNFKIDLEKLEKTLSCMSSDVPKLILFNNPNNPTGTIHTPEEVEKLAKILDKYNVIVFSDEIYANLAYVPTVSISTYLPHLTIRGSSISKDLGCGGHRLGWITFPSELSWLFQRCSVIASSIYSCTTIPIQYATANVLNNYELMNKICNDTKNVFSLIIQEVCECIDSSKCKDKILYVYPQAAWYLFLNFDRYKSSLIKQGIHNGVELQEFLLNKYGLVTVAGINFNVSGFHLRLSLVDITIDDHTGLLLNHCKIKEGIQLLLEYFENL
jgi:aspartate aminotransferase